MIKNKKAGPVPLRVPEDMRAKVKEVAAKSGLSEADVMRMSIERGIAAVEKLFAMRHKQAA